jgi:hypothetical protein
MLTKYSVTELYLNYFGHIQKYSMVHHSLQFKEKIPQPSSFQSCLYLHLFQYPHHDRIPCSQKQTILMRYILVLN